MANGTRYVYEALSEKTEWPDVEVIEYECLGNCEQCAVQPFVMVEGEVVAADSPESLIKEIKEFLKKKEELDRQWRELGF